MTPPSRNSLSTEPQFFSFRGEGVIQCTLCPHRCLLAPGQTGLCGVRTNRRGRPALPWYGRITSLAMDPVEKKPLYHFLPGTRTFSVGFGGCNMRCPYCQNWSISQIQEGSPSFRTIAPRDLVSRARASEAPSLSFTYSEPSLHVEYILETARRAHREGLKTILVTNGHLNREPAEALLREIDAVNVDLKSFDAVYYRKVLKGDLAAVKAFIRRAADRGIHMEITTLLVPRHNDDPLQLKALFHFLAEINPAIPLHISRYHPAWHCTEEPTERQTLLTAVESAQNLLEHVYPGNLLGS